MFRIDVRAGRADFHPLTFIRWATTMVVDLRMRKFAYQNVTPSADPGHPGRRPTAEARSIHSRRRPR